jgi:hypothetical protein
LKATRQAIDATTGGGSFVYLEYRGESSESLDVIKTGLSPLYDVSVAITSCENPKDRSNLPEDYDGGCLEHVPRGGVHLGDFPAGGFNLLNSQAGDLPSLVALSPKNELLVRPDTSDIFLIAEFRARNGQWVQYIWIHRVKPNLDAWEQATAIYKKSYNARGFMSGNYLIYQDVPYGFPPLILKQNLQREISRFRER